MSGRVGLAEGACGEEHVVPVHQAVVGGHRGALDKHQQLLLHALALDAAVRATRRHAHARVG